MIMNQGSRAARDRLPRLGRGKRRPPFRRQSIAPMPTVWLRTAGELSVDWRHASVAVLLPCGCHGVWPNVLDRGVTDLPRGGMLGTWSNVSGTFETRYDRR